MATNGFHGWLQRFYDENHNLIVTCCLVGAGVVLFRRWRRGARCRSTIQLHGKTVIVTGADAGIGREVAKEFAKRGARVIMACRNVESAAVVANILQENTKCDVLVRRLDLASFASVRAFVKAILETETRVDILINNSGILCPKSKTEDGFDLAFVTNYLGPFLLTNLLVDKLKKSAPSRIITVTSAGHKRCRGMQWDDLNLERPGAYTPWKAYFQGKLANILFSKELSARLLGTGVTTYAVHPGFVPGELKLYLPEMSGWFFRMAFHIAAFLFGKSSVQGAQTIIYCAVADELQNKTGYYYRNCHESSPTPTASDLESAARLWELSAKMVGLENNNEKQKRKR